MRVYVILLLMIGATSEKAAFRLSCDKAFCQILKDTNKVIVPLSDLIENGKCVSQLGNRADQILSSAVEKLESAVTPSFDERDVENDKIYKNTVQNLNQVVEAILRPLFVNQMKLIEVGAMDTFKRVLDEKGESEAILAADEEFRQAAEQVRRASGEWSFGRELRDLQARMRDIATRNRQLSETKLEAAEQIQRSLQYLQMQQQQIQAIRQQVQGGSSSSPWNLAAAYRLPQTNINLSLLYQEGRANVQLSCVPDESTALLGPNGFVNGVTSGNVGLSCNINI